MKSKRFLAGVLAGILITLSAGVLAGVELNGWLDFDLTSVPPNPGAGKLRLFASSGSGNLECLTSAGGSCIGGGSDSGDFSAAGTFTNTENTYALQGLLNSCNPLTEYQYGQGANFAAVGVTGCVKVEAASVIHGALGVFGAVESASSETDAVAGYFSAAATGDSARLWAINPLLTDRGFGGVLLTNELDFNVTGVGTHILGLQFTGIASQDMTADSAGVVFGPLSGHKWPVALYCTDAAVDYCVHLGTNTSGNNSTSQKLRFRSRNSGGATSDAQLYQNPDGVMILSNTGLGGIVPGSIPFVNLGSTQPDGTMVFCSNCTNASNPCTGGGSGAIAKKLNGAWDCR